MLWATFAEIIFLMPKASVIMPCFNHARFVVESADAILQQSFRDLELIIVDDCSSDNSWEVIQSVAGKDSRVKAIRHARNQGASKSRNDGLRAAAGDFIGFCDADDIWEKDKLKEQVKLLQGNPAYDLTYCDSIIIDENGLPTGKRFSQLFPPPKPHSGSLFPELERRNFVNMQSVLMRKGCIQRVGYFDENIKWVEDWLYWVMLSRHHRFLYCRDALARYRMHPRSTNRVQKRGYCINRFKVFRRILRHYPEPAHRLPAEIIFKMGVELCELGKFSIGRRLLWRACRTAIGDARTLPICARALRRLVICAGNFGLKSEAVVK
jgi:glycosyltransferase involved in cell wall biosynthesis